MKKIFIPLLLAGFNLFAQSSLNVTLAAHYPYGTGRTCANICGYVDTTGREYALVGVDNGMSVVDVTTPTSPTQVYQIPWPFQNSNSEWKEIKVYKKHAYVVSEAGGGVQIVDLSHLPSVTVPVPTYWKPVVGTQTLNTIHALHIDTTKGNIYCYGSNIGNKGAVIGSLANPAAPAYLGKFNNTYVHDGYVDNDTLWACEVYAGNLQVVDCSNKTSPSVIATVQTPLAFTHNSWLSPDRKTVFTTDEKTKSYLTSYDVTALPTLTLLDTIKGLTAGSIVHNTHIRKDNFAVTSWYRDGFTIVDVSHPNNMIMTGYYDTYPSGSGNGFNGDWGVYPFFPSGTIVVSNIEDGLWVFSPNYVKACYLEGNVKDTVTQFNLQNVAVQILTVTNSNTNSDVSGNYANGAATAGTYNVQFSKAGYQTKIINGVSLQNGITTTLNTQLAPLGFGVASVQNNETFLTGQTLFAERTTLKYYLSNADAANGVIKVFDYSGNLVMEQKLGAMMGEVVVGENWPAGMYVVTVNGGKPMKIVKTN